MYFVKHGIHSHFYSLIDSKEGSLGKRQLGYIDLHSNDDDQNDPFHRISLEVQKFERNN